MSLGVDSRYQQFLDMFSISGIIIIIILAIAAAAAALIARGAIFRKAGEPFWYTFIPFVNSWILYKITWGHGAYMFLEFIPVAGAVISIITQVKLGTAFGKSGGFKAGLVFLSLVFEIILGYDRSKYLGPVH